MQRTTQPRPNGRPPGSVSAASETSIQSFRILLAPLTYIRVGHIDIETCNSCGGPVKVIGCIEAPDVIEKILTHLDSKAAFGASGVYPVSGATAGKFVHLLGVSARE
jgi:hypothetical protein